MANVPFSLTSLPVLNNFLSVDKCTPPPIRLPNKLAKDEAKNHLHIEASRSTAITPTTAGTNDPRCVHSHTSEAAGTTSSRKGSNIEQRANRAGIRQSQQSPEKPRSISGTTSECNIGRGRGGLPSSQDRNSIDNRENIPHQRNVTKTVPACRGVPTDFQQLDENTPHSIGGAQQSADQIGKQRDLPSALLLNSSSINFDTLTIYRGPCGNPLKIPNEANCFVATSPDSLISSDMQRFRFPCGCCYAGVKKAAVRTACEGICSLLQHNPVEMNETMWKDLYATERLNRGSVEPFLSGSKNLLSDRAKIVNWMSYVCSKLGFQSSVFFLAVNLFDLYVERSGKSFKSSTLPPVAASAFLQAANIIEVGSDGKLPSLREFVCAAPWLESCSQVLAIQLDMIKVIITPRPMGASDNTGDGQRFGTLIGKTPCDFLLLYLTELSHSQRWNEIWTSIVETGTLIELYFKCISAADLACQRGVNLTISGSTIVAVIFLQTLNRHLKHFTASSLLQRFCRDIFKLSWHDDIAAASEALVPLLDSVKASAYPVCGSDMGASAPAVQMFLKRLTLEQKEMEKMNRHQYRIFSRGSLPAPSNSGPVCRDAPTTSTGLYRLY